jgi:ATP-dependent RNA helicase DDX19/DBP5
MTFTKKLSDPPTPTSEQSSANNQEQEETDTPASITDRSLVAKKVNTTLRDPSALVVDRGDPNSPLYSLTSFEELQIKPDLLKGQSTC